MIPRRRVSTAIAFAAAIVFGVALNACAIPARETLPTTSAEPSSSLEADPSSSLETDPPSSQEAEAISTKTEAISKKTEATPKNTAVGEPTASPTEGSSVCADGTYRRDTLLGGTNPVATWGGTIVEPHGLRYSLRADLSDDGCDIVGTFEYVELGCSGVWRAARVDVVHVGTGLQQGLNVDFSEHVTNDPQNACAPTAHVSLVYGPAGLFYASEWLRGDGTETSSRTHLDLL